MHDKFLNLTPGKLYPEIITNYPPDWEDFDRHEWVVGYSGAVSKCSATFGSNPPRPIVKIRKSEALRAYADALKHLDQYQEAVRNLETLLKNA